MVKSMIHCSKIFIPADLQGENLDHSLDVDIEQKSILDNSIFPCIP